MDVQDKNCTFQNTERIFSKVRVTIDLKGLIHNYRLLASGSSSTLAVVKADAYGHGLFEVAEALAGAALPKSANDFSPQSSFCPRPGPLSFAVGTIEEAVALRNSGRMEEILSLLGPLGPSEEFGQRDDYALALANGIVVTIHSPEQLESLSKAAAESAFPESAREAEPLSIPVALKFDTGMRRLGFCEEDCSFLLDFFRANPRLRPSIIFSHLACADMPEEAEFTLGQKKCLQDIVALFKDAGCNVRPSLANSAALLRGISEKQIFAGLGRPGIALYGANPFYGSKDEFLGKELSPVMSASAPVIALRNLGPGEGISYGRTFIADRDMRVAVLAVGYADGYLRCASNKSMVCIRGHKVPLLGRVCMQMILVDVSTVPDCHIGDAAYLLGGAAEDHIPAEEVAEWMSTIAYEVFLSMGCRNRRLYKS